MWATSLPFCLHMPIMSHWARFVASVTAKSSKTLPSNIQAHRTGHGPKQREETWRDGQDHIWAHLVGTCWQWWDDIEMLSSDDSIWNEQVFCFSRKRPPAVIERCDQTDGGWNGNILFSPVECSLSEGLWVEFDVNKWHKATEHACTHDHNHYSFLVLELTHCCSLADVESNWFIQENTKTQLSFSHINSSNRISLKKTQAFPKNLESAASVNKEWQLCLFAVMEAAQVAPEDFCYQELIRNLRATLIKYNYTPSPSWILPDEHNHSLMNSPDMEM